ncbi:MAG: Molybdate-binding periplasmic protein precursor [Syntrophorhabdus sp. PtaU1.Bin002]|nr:MAG: Molybdate-binding periplasmic protein precursor [Syntrophorhabdus sp. PtaB.Bin006]OPY71406.1 MAG: Molybdate-binding periplasmic protein precursor [Syntrophorhabdus sp. PtaU1.Bin002]
MKRVVLTKGLWIVLALLLVVTGTPWGVFAAGSNEITVSAAASLKNVFEEIGKTYDGQNKGGKTYFNFAASGDLKRQIEAGAPVDVFASAALREMDDLERRGLLVAGTRRNFAGNEMVLARPALSKVQISSFKDLTRPEVKKIAIGNPATVPAGMYAEQVLKHLRIWDEVKDKLIFGESVRQVLDYVARGEVDAGMVFSTDAKVRAKEVAVVMQAPRNSHNPVIYPIAVVKGARNADGARSFVDFVSSADGKKILEKYGFKAEK